MHTVLITGALGSGKTTLLLPLAEALKGAGRRVGILENDAGRVPVDAPSLRSRGLAVEDLASGCICCNLSSEVPRALSALREALDSEILLIEPSGMAAPGIVSGTIRSLLEPGDTMTAFYLFDLVEYSRRDRGLSPFHLRAMESADVVVPTKASMVSGDCICRFRLETERRRILTPVVFPDGIVADTRLSGVISPGSRRAGDGAGREKRHLIPLEPSEPVNAFAARYRLGWNREIRGTDAMNLLAGVLDSIRSEVLAADGCQLGTAKISTGDGGGSIIAVSDEVTPVGMILSGTLRDAPEDISINVLTRGEIRPWESVVGRILESVNGLEAVTRI